jgi:zinc transport system substrate-binding protein
MSRLVLIFLLLLPALPQAAPLQVFVSVPPQQTLVERVGGQWVDVRSMVRPGHSPHNYDPTPRQIADLAQTRLYVRTGVPFEDAWMARIRAANPTMRVLDARSGIDPADMRGHDHGDHQDPHLWTSPPLLGQMASEVRDALSELDPAHQAEFARNFDAFAAELDALDRELQALFAPLQQRSFMVFHPAWGHFADRYGLKQVAIEHEGKEPGARALATLIEQARRNGVGAIFVQPQFDRRHAAQVAQAIGARVVVIDPLGKDILDNLRRAGRAIAGSLQP